MRLQSYLDLRNFLSHGVMTTRFSPAGSWIVRLDFVQHHKDPATVRRLVLSQADAERHADALAALTQQLGCAIGQLRKKLRHVDIPSKIEPVCLTTP